MKIMVRSTTKDITRNYHRTRKIIQGEHTPEVLKTIYDDRGDSHNGVRKGNTQGQLRNEKNPSVTYLQDDYASKSKYR